jgi:parallel beta-helix repeat protein
MLLLTVLFFGAWMGGDVWAHASGVLLSSWSSAPPNIDGIMNPDEWASADVISFATLGGILPARTGTLYIMNDATNLYIAVAMPDTTPGLSDQCYFYFDNDHDRIFEKGDDSLRTQSVHPASIPEYWDLHWNPDVPGWTEDFYPGYGIYGTIDGSGDACNIEGVNYFEFSHPLDSTDDAYDFSLSQGDTVGFALGYYDSGESVGWFPGIPGHPEDYGDINIASPPEPRTWTVDDDGPAHFHTIQEAINTASSGDTIFVHSGIYCENLVVDKAISLIGENKGNTVIDGKREGTGVRIDSDYVTVRDFTIQNSSRRGDVFVDCGVYSSSAIVTVDNCNIIRNQYGVVLFYSNGFTLTENTIASNDATGIFTWTQSGTKIMGNVISNNLFDGIFMRFVTESVISGNMIASNKQMGISLYDSSSNSIINNTISANMYQGIYLGSASENIVTQNTIADNLEEEGVQLYESNGNLIYHNNFVNNVPQVENHWSTNAWDDGYPSGGNYWSDYSGMDWYSGAGQDVPSRDGIGDTPYIIDSNNKDRYPLMDPWIERKVGVNIGDWVKYGDFVVEWSSDDPSANPPSDYEFWRSIEWTKTTVEAISGTTITFEFLIHLRDGTEQSSIGDIDVDTGVGFPFYFISADLAAGYTTYAGGIGYGPGPKINETVLVEYLGTLRETNHLNLSRFYEDYFGWKNYRESYNFYWDRATGVQTEYSYQRSFETGTEAYLTAELTSFIIVDTNLWGTPPAISATLDINPDTLNLRSKSKWITAYIQLPEGYSAADVNASTILLNGTIAPVLDQKYDFVTNSSEYLVDHNDDGILERIVKFDRALLQSWIYQSVGMQHEVSLTITGELTDGTLFEGTATILAFWQGRNSPSRR